MEDSSLDEFFEADDERAESVDENPGEGSVRRADRTETELPDSQETDERASQTDVESASPTSRWERKAVCPRCGADGVRLWNDERTYVCQDCKEW